MAYSLSGPFHKGRENMVASAVMTASSAVKSQGAVNAGASVPPLLLSPGPWFWEPCCPINLI